MSRSLFNLSKFELLTLIFGLFSTLILTSLQIGRLYVWDEGGYINAGLEMERLGLLAENLESDLRTFGYPFFLSIITSFENLLGLKALESRLSLSIVQGVFYFGAAFMLRHQAI